ncbi:MAG TPA: hypothetical protein VGO24_02690 [Solirubrobacterales bacterium]|jgi:hypothetical protein|nr:hypothetical protein [Solirubrobacterales bacterium]
MRRIPLILAAAVACAVLAIAGTASAKPAAKTCTTYSKNVIGNPVTGTLTASNVNSVQKAYATCGQAKKAMNQVLGYRVEEPKSVAGYYCVPTVLKTAPDVVRYKCTFKGADTPMFVKLVFQVKYNLD